MSRGSAEDCQGRGTSPCAVMAAACQRTFVQTQRGPAPGVPPEVSEDCR